MNKQRQELAREAETIMLTGGFTQARAEHMGRFWRVCGELADKNEHSGTTFHQLDPQDPRELARSLVALARPTVAATEPEPDGYESAEAIASEVPTFAPEDDPFGVAPPSEPEQDSAHESDGETGEESEAAEQVWSDVVAADSDDGRADGQGVAVVLRSDSGDGGEEPGGEPADALDADFTEDPLLEFGGEVLEEHPEEHGSGAFIFGDNLEQQRTAAIGIVVRISRGKQADIRALMGDADFAQLQGYVLRDTIDGVYRGPPETYATFVELSRHQSAINRVKYAEADKVEFLDKATRADLEAFNPEADWPE